MNLLHEMGLHPTGLDQFKARLEIDHRPGIGETLDRRLIEHEDGRVEFDATPDIHLCNPLGTDPGGKFYATASLIVRSA